MPATAQGEPTDKAQRNFTDPESCIMVRNGVFLQAYNAQAAVSESQVIVEPVFGQIKQAMGFRRFSLRGLAKVAAEWGIVCLCHNLLKLFRATATRQAVAG